MRALVFFTLLLASACGGGASSGLFAPTFPDNRPEDLDQVMSRLRSIDPEQEAPVVVGVADGKLFAWDLVAKAPLWERPVSARTAPHVAGRTVVIQEDTGVVARDLRTGAEHFRLDDESLHLIGAGGEGDLAAIVLSTGGGVGAHSRLVVAREGSVDWDAEVDYALGIPAVRAGMVFVPWGSQNVSVLDAESGAELARLRVADEVLAEAFAAGTDVYAGQSGVFRITPSIASGTRERAAHFTPGQRELPGRPSFLVNAYSPPPAPGSAVHKIRLEWFPGGSGETLAPADENLYLVFYKLVFALSPDASTVRWVYEHPRDIVGATAQPGGLWIGCQGGGVSFLDAETGLPIRVGRTGTQPSVMEFRPSGHRPTGTPEGEALPLRDQLLAAAQNTDARLVPAQALAVEYLATMDDPEVTTNLIALCQSSDAPAGVRSAACGKLAERRVGGDQILAALERHAAYLEGTTTPPVGALARAAVAMEERRAVPMLIAHLRDPATATADLGALLAALGALGDRGAAAPIRDFLRLYHAEAADDELAAGLNAGLEALVSLQGPVARETLEEIGNDPLTMAPVRAKARALVTALDQQPEQAEEAEAADDTEETAAESSEPGEELPERINAAIVREVLSPVDRELRQCLAQAEGRPRSARLIIRLTGEGAIEQLSVTPAAVVECVEPLVRAQTFPANRRRSAQQVVYTLRR